MDSEIGQHEEQVDSRQFAALYQRVDRLSNTIEEMRSYAVFYPRLKELPEPTIQRNQGAVANSSPNWRQIAAQTLAVIPLFAAAIYFVEDRFVNEKTFAQFAESVDRHFEQVDRRFEQIDRRFEQVEERLGRVEKGISKMEGKLDLLIQKFVQRD